MAESHPPATRTSLSALHSKILNSSSKVPDCRPIFIIKSREAVKHRSSLLHQGAERNTRERCGLHTQRGPEERPRPRGQGSPVWLCHRRPSVPPEHPGRQKGGNRPAQCAEGTPVGVTTAVRSAGPLRLAAPLPLLLGSTVERRASSARATCAGREQRRQGCL